MSLMTLNDVWPREDRLLTVDDLERLPDDGNRYELVDGVLEVSPAPCGDHERVAARLSALLQMLAPDGFEAPGAQGVNLGEYSCRVPDLTVIRSEWFNPKFQVQPPLLAVEVASKSTRKLDRTTKKREYETFGIESYWIVIPDFERPSLTAFGLHDGKYEQVASVIGDEEFHATNPFPVTIVPSLLVADGNAWKAGLR